MNNRARTLAALNYQPYDRLPLLHFGFWRETLYQWAAEGHLMIPQVGQSDEKRGGRKGGFGGKRGGKDRHDDGGDSW